MDTQLKKLGYGDVKETLARKGGEGQVKEVGLASHDSSD